MHVNLGPPYDDVDAINKHFADKATNSAYDTQQIDSFIKFINVEYSQLFSQYDIFRVLSQVKHTALGVDPQTYWLFKYYTLELSQVTFNLFKLVRYCQFLQNYGSTAYLLQ